MQDILWPFLMCFQMKKRGAFQIFVDDYVTDDSGTGVVHSAPAFGEVCSSSSMIFKCEYLR